MNAVFVDTNVFVYRYDRSEPSKQQVAQEWLDILWRTKAGRTGVQVLHELYVTLTRKLSNGFAPEEARRVVRALEAWQPIISDLALVSEAWEIEQRYSFSYWDALIVAAALRGSASVLLTEDLQDGMSIGSLTIVNPFTAASPVDVIHE